MIKLFSHFAESTHNKIIPTMNKNYRYNTLPCLMMPCLALHHLQCGDALNSRQSISLLSCLAFYADSGSIHWAISRATG